MEHIPGKGCIGDKFILRFLIVWRYVQSFFHLIGHLNGNRILNWKSLPFRILKALLYCIQASSFFVEKPKPLVILFLLNVTFPLTLDSFQNFFFFVPTVLKFHGDVLVHLFLTHRVEYSVGPFSLETHVLQFWEFSWFISLVYTLLFSLFSLHVTSVMWVVYLLDLSSYYLLVWVVLL